MHNNSINKQTYANELLADRYSKMIELNLKGNIDFLNLLTIKLAEGNLSESVFQEKVNNYLKNHPEFIKYPSPHHRKKAPSNFIYNLKEF